MENRKKTVHNEFANHYNSRQYGRIYPAEFVVRTFMTNPPELKFQKPSKGDTVVDISCGYGRNLLFLCEQGYNAFATEATQQMCDSTKQRMKQFGYSPEILTGKNHDLPFEDGFADYILAAYCIHFCDEGTTMENNIAEYARILREGGWLVTCIMHKDVEFLKGARSLGNGIFLVPNDVPAITYIAGYTIYAVGSTNQLVHDFSPFFDNFSFGEEKHDIYGHPGHYYWMVCRKKTACS